MVSGQIKNAKPHHEHSDWWGCRRPKVLDLCSIFLDYAMEQFFQVFVICLQAT